MKRPIVGPALPLVCLLSLTACQGEGDAEAATAEAPVRAEPRVETVAVLPGAGTGGMDVDAGGTIYMADFGTALGGGTPGSTVWRVTPGGEVSAFATGLVGASGNDFDSQGNLIQSNVASGDVSRIAPDGTVSTLASGLRTPVGVEVLAGDTAYVVNCNANLISKITPAGDVSVFSQDSLLSCPNGISRADDGNLYVANFGNGDVVRVSSDGSAERLVTLPGGNNGHLLFGNGVLYVVARSAHRIYEVTLDGEAEVIAGSGERGLDDGPALEATLSYPNDVALDPDGRVLYFNDVGRADDGTFVEDGGRTLAPSVVRKLILR